MITLQEISPSPLMREYVRFYHYNELLLGNEILFKPLPARPEQCVQFSFGDAYQVVNRTTGKGQRATGIVIQGRQTERYIDLAATGHVVTFTIHFQPTGFFRLFHIPLPELTNLTPDGLDVVGPEMNELYEQL